MSHDAACADLIRKGFGTRIITRETTIATVEEAAATVGVGVERIAKTLSFLQNGRPVLIVAAGNVKIDNRKYKDRFGVKASMIPGASVEELVGHAPGGVCPFGIREGVEVWLDASLKLYETVHLACGDDRTTIEFDRAGLGCAGLGRRDEAHRAEGLKGRLNEAQENGRRPQGGLPFSVS